MRRITRQTVRLLKAESVVDMFEKLNSKKIPLRSVQLQSKKMCTGLHQARVEELAHKVMNWKYTDAKNTLREEKKRNTREKREAIRILTECAPQQIPAFTKTLEEEKKYQRRALQKKKKKKVEFLNRKYGTSGKNKETEINVSGIIIRDEPLPSTFENKCKVYGGVNLSEQETRTLELPPKYTVYNPIKMADIEVELEKCITKIRWNDMSKWNATKPLQNLQQNEESYQIPDNW